MTRKSMVEIIDQTVSYYSEDVSRRSVLCDGTCVYIGPDGKRCAYARMCTDDSQFIEGKVLRSQYDAKIKDEYDGYTTDFYVDIQDIHDRGWFWSESGLTLEGRSHVQFLKHKYAEQ